MLLRCFQTQSVRERGDDGVDVKKVGVSSKCEEDEDDDGEDECETTMKAASIRILHFNDVYAINNEEGKPGGAARFASVLLERASASASCTCDDNAMTTTGEALVLFSGDVFSPSLEGNLFKGEHMVPVLQRLKVFASCVGNHDLDYGEPRLHELVRACGFPWLMANVRFKDGGTLLAGSKESIIVNWHGRRIGIMGLVESEWFDTLTMVDVDALVFEDFVTKGREIARKMRDEEKCDLIVALTHMRLPNDERLAREVREIDLVLGGHDHHYHVARYAADGSVICTEDDHGRHDGRMNGEDATTTTTTTTAAHRAEGRSGCGGNWVVKSGTDFKDFTELIIRFVDEGDGKESSGSGASSQSVKAKSKTKSNAKSEAPPHASQGFSLQHTRFEITGDLKVRRDPVIADIITKYSTAVEESLDEVIGITETALDCRFKQIRSSETALGSFMCDVIRENCEADVVIINSGTFRSDQMHGPGDIKQRDLTLILPFMDDVIVLLELTGAQVLEALENGVSMYPRLEGRFPQVSGISFAFDPNMESGTRVLPRSVMILGNGDTKPLPIDLTKTYKVATKSFLASGRDGYGVFTRARLLVHHEDGWILPTVIRNFFVDSKAMMMSTPSVPTPRQKWASGADKANMKRKSLCLSPSELLDHLNNRGLCRVAGGMIIISPRRGERIRLASMPVAAPT